MKKCLISFALLSAFFLYAQAVRADDTKVIITGDEMRVKKGGKVTEVRGNAKAVSGDRTITSKRMVYDKPSETITAYDNVIVTTSTGTVTGDNLVLERNSKKAYMTKDKVRPVADMKDEDKTALYEADSITFYQEGGTNKILMEGEVKGKVNFPDDAEIPEPETKKAPENKKEQKKKSKKPVDTQTQNEINAQADNVFYADDKQEKTL